MKIAIEMGKAANDAAAMLDLEELLATRLLVQGNSGSGKSHLLRRLLEQSAPWVQQCVIDPEGDFVTLSDKFGHLVVDGARTEAELTRIAGRVRQHRVSVVLNLEGLDIEQQMRCAAAFLGGMFDAERDYWYPVLVVVDEAQLFAPAAAGEVSDEARTVSLGAMTNLMSRGVIATQRLAKLAKNVAAEASNFLMGRTFLDIDMARAADLLGMERRQAEMFRDLQRGSQGGFPHGRVILVAVDRRRLVGHDSAPVNTQGHGALGRCGLDGGNFRLLLYCSPFGQFGGLGGFGGTLGRCDHLLPLQFGALLVGSRLGLGLDAATLFLLIPPRGFQALALEPVGLLAQPARLGFSGGPFGGDAVVLFLEPVAGPGQQAAQRRLDLAGGLAVLRLHLGNRLVVRCQVGLLGSGQVLLRRAEPFD